MSAGGRAPGSCGHNRTCCGRSGCSYVLLQSYTQGQSYGLILTDRM
nr:MAG TPA: hypothetical protein [Caudoviricetes sp.]